MAGTGALAAGAFCGVPAAAALCGTFGVAAGALDTPDVALGTGDSRVTGVFAALTLSCGAGGAGADELSTLGGADGSEIGLA